MRDESSLLPRKISAAFGDRRLHDFSVKKSYRGLYLEINLELKGKSLCEKKKLCTYMYIYILFPYSHISFNLKLLTLIVILSSHQEKNQTLAFRAPVVIAQREGVGIGAS